MSNTNCLESMQCPKCGNADSLLITVLATARVTDDGAVIVSSEHEWFDDSVCMCANYDCEFTSVVKDFKRNLEEELLSALQMAAAMLQRFEHGEKPYQTDDEGEEIHATICAAIVRGENEIPTLEKEETSGN